MNFLRILINKISIVFVALILVVSSVNANSRLEVEIGTLMMMVEQMH